MLPPAEDASSPSNIFEMDVPAQIQRASSKRVDYIEWEDYFMAVAFLSAKRSKDPNTQVGACIVNPEKKIVGTGYNGMPIGCSDDVLPWGKNSDCPLETKYMYVCHAEMNAILNKNCADIKGCTIYTALFPCNECAKVIIQSGIREVVYLADKHAHKPSTKASRILLQMAGISVRQYIPKMSRIVIDFDPEKEIQDLVSRCENLGTEN